MMKPYKIPHWFFMMRMDAHLYGSPLLIHTYDGISFYSGSDSERTGRETWTPNERILWYLGQFSTDDIEKINQLYHFADSHITYSPVSPTEFNDCGYISPTGECWNCREKGHSLLAQKITAVNHFELWDNAERHTETLRQLGYVMVAYSLANVENDALTDAQIEAIIQIVENSAVKPEIRQGLNNLLIYSDVRSKYHETIQELSKTLRKSILEQIEKDES